MKIAVLGAGAYGTALGGILTENGHIIDYYDPAVSPKTLEDVLSGVETIISSVPSEALPQLLPKIPKNIFLIVATKGLLEDHYFAEFTDWGVVSGPGFAADIKAKQPTYLTVTDNRIIELFNTDYIYFDSTADRLGVMMCGSLKNAYALYAGYKGLEPTTKELEDYLDNAGKEMRLILSANQAEPDTVNLHCGIDDLKVTCNPKSRNYSFGSLLREDPNHQPNNTVEGLSVLKRIKSGEISVPQEAKFLQELIEMSSQWN